ncbi:MAG: hypothetical protein IVW54_02240 [Candidatus Binataceae bacterium]|nr:hypothetical protein [Candidatus Binataceae bacterium]
MVPVDGILEGHLPVALVGVSEDAAADDNLAVRCEVNKLVEEPDGSAQAGSRSRRGIRDSSLTVKKVRGNCS